MSTLFLGASIFFSQNPFAGWYFFTRFLLLSFLVWYVSAHTFFIPLVGSLLSSGIIFESILALLQLIHQGSLGGFLYFFGERAFSSSTPGIANAAINGQLFLRPYGTFSHPNILAGFFVVSMFLVLSFFQAKKDMWYQLLLTLALVCGSIGLVATLSRTALVVWVFCIGIMLFLKYIKKGSRKILLIGMLLESFLVLLFVFFPPLLSRFLPSSFGDSLSGREELAKSAVAMIGAHPLFGVGPNNFISSLPSFSANSLTLQPVHSIYFLVASETGIIGLLFFAGLVLFIFSFSLKTSKRKDISSLPLMLSFVSILLIGLFDHYFITAIQGQYLFALVIGLLLQRSPQRST